ncbi:MAG: hypothetical protein C0498_01445 [Anaerolinea sp.]|nr:hypothetical protein [Anaerolinea sp.]
MTPDTYDTLVMRFADGDFVVPRWWASLAPLRRGPEYGDLAPPLPFTLAEAREIVNKELERVVMADVIGRYIAEHRARR